MIPADGPSKPLIHARPTTPLHDHSQGALALNGAFPPAHYLPLPAPTGLSGPPTLGALLVALKRRWFAAGAMAILAAIGAVVVIAYIFPPKYVSQARLELASRPARPLLVQHSGDHEVDVNTYRANQQAIIKSPLVLSSALNNEKLKGLPIAGRSPESLEKSLKVDFAQGPEIMTIKLLGDEPDYLADLLNAVIQAYIKEIEARDNQRRVKVIGDLDKSLQENKKKLAEKRIEVGKAERDEKIPDPVSQQAAYQALAVQKHGTETSLRNVRDDLSNKNLEIMAKKAQLENIDLQPVSTAKLRQLLLSSPSMQQLNADIGKLNKEIVTWMTFPKTETRDDAVKSLNEQIKAMQENLKTVEDAERPALEKLVRAEMQDTLEQEIRTLGGNVRLLDIQEKSLTRDLEKLLIEIQTLNPATHKGGVLVQKLRDDVTQMEKAQEMLALQVALQKSEPSIASRIVVLQPAETPTDKDYSRFMKLGLAGGLGMFGLVLFGVAFLEFSSRKINAADEVTQGLGLTLVGTLPRLSARAQREAQGAATPRQIHLQSIITESVDAIRTQLLHAARSDGVQVVMVTSASGGEGKTSLSSQLAASLARAWRKTLLVDGDLRNPAAHKLFRLPLEPGFSELLRGEAGLGDVVKPTPLSRLWLLPAGHLDPHAIQALAQEDVRAIFEQMKEQYDFIIVDSCPVLPVADSLLLGQHVDAVIFAVLRDVSRLPSIQAAQQKLQGLGVRMLGAVVIGTDGDPGSVVYRYTTQTGS